MLVIASFRPFPLKVLPDKVSFSLGEDIFKKSTPSLSFFFTIDRMVTVQRMDTSSLMVSLQRDIKIRQVITLTGPHSKKHSVSRLYDASLLTE